ncbi:unnamed protein product [Blepharisma stoltei]|uniref:Uncharacterized protein n=1 Tax=Blepharisma stoltei TaxID=1481888 RepID=A0AAU9K2D7_9CILI|nr:unnamed protein product [Blepharisma stoltei]
MEGDQLEHIFLVTCMPGFFKKELYNILSAQNSENSTETFRKLINVLDTIISILKIHSIDLYSVLPEIFKDFLLDNIIHTTTFQLKVQLMLNCELLRASEFNQDPKFWLKIGELVRTLCIKLAIEEDSTAFYKYYVTEFLPRYATQLDSGVLLKFSELIELQNETETYLNKIIIVQSSPKKNQAPKMITKKIPTSPVRKSERIRNIVIKNEKKKLQVDRNLNNAHTIKKQVFMKSKKSKAPHTPDKEMTEISNCAKKLKEINQNYFYEKKNLDDKEEIEREDSRILAIDTPIKENKLINYEISHFKNLFAMAGTS